MTTTNAENSATRVAERGLATARVTDDTHRPPELDQLDMLIGRWVTEGQTARSGEVPSTSIVASDVYTWLPGAYFVMHTAYGRFGPVDVGGLEVIGYDSDTGQYQTHFFDSQGNHSTQQLSYADGVWTWHGSHARCFGKVTDGGRTIIAEHERSDDGKRWEPSMTVTLRKVE